MGVERAGVVSDAYACRAASCNGIRLRRPSTALAMALPSARTASAFRCALGLSLSVCQRPQQIADAFKLLHMLCCATVGHILSRSLQALSRLRVRLGVHAQGPAKADLEAVEL